jgi:hypothetical protein
VQQPAPADRAPEVAQRRLRRERAVHQAQALGQEPHAAVRLKLSRYRRLYERPLPAELHWAQPHAERMGELMEELTLRA